MIGAILGITIPIFYVCMMALTFGFNWMFNERTQMISRDSDAGYRAWICAMWGIVWPIYLPVFVVWVFCLKRTGEIMTRAERKNLAYEERRLDIQQKLLQTQKEYNALLEKDNKMIKGTSVSTVLEEMGPRPNVQKAMDKYGREC